MEEIKNIIDDLAIAALEGSTKLAAVAIMSNSGNIVFQTENFDLKNQENIILSVIKGDNSFVLNNSNFTVTDASPEGIIATNDSGMGYLILLPFDGGAVISYAMPGADTHGVLNFLKPYALKLNGKI